MIYIIIIEGLRKINLRVSLLKIFRKILITLSGIKYLYFFQYLLKSKILILNHNDIPNRQTK